MKKRKNAQVTVFIAIGLALLIIGGILIYLNSIDKVNTIVVEPIVDDVPENFKMVQAYVLKCLDDVAAEGLTKLGENGGYISLNDSKYLNKAFKLGALPTESDVVYLGQTHPVPYWWHMKSRNKCFECEMSNENIPTPEEITEQLGKYVDFNLPSCLGDFSEFKAQGFNIIKEKPPKTIVTITPERVLFQTVLPIEASKGSSNTHFENFGQEINAPLGKMYSLAQLITAKEMGGQYLENVALNLITSYSEIDAMKLPPIAGFRTGGSSVMWTKSYVMLRFKDLLSSNIGLIQVENTDGAEILSSESIYDQAMYKNLYLDNNITFKNISASFLYLDWPIYFDITPSTGELLGPTSHRNEFPNNIIPAIETQSYEFFYDISYPVIVELRDDSALSGNGFSFIFALEGNVRDNKNTLEWHLGKGTIGQYDYSRTKIDLKSGVNSSYKTYDSSTNTTLNMSFKKPSKSLMCNYDQRVGSDMDLSAMNAKTDGALSGASIAFGCGNFKTCPSFGITDSAGYFSGTLPVCIGSFVRIDKDGFLSVVVANLSSVPDSILSLGNIYLEPIRIKKASAKVVPIMMINSTKNPGPELAGNVHAFALPLEKGESILITLTRVKANDFEQDFFQTLIVESDAKQDLKLVPGNYSLELTFTDNEGVIIPSRTEIVGTEKVEYPEVDMKPAMLGTTTIDDTTGGYWEVRSKDLEKGSVTFYALKMEKPKIVEDLSEFGKFANYSETYRLVILPTFS
jgi:hypothetical protein